MMGARPGYGGFSLEVFLMGVSSSISGSHWVKSHEIAMKSHENHQKITISGRNPMQTEGVIICPLVV